MSLLDQLKEKRDNARTRIAEIQAEYGHREKAPESVVEEILTLGDIENNTSEQIIELQDKEIRESRAASVRRRGGNPNQPDVLRNTDRMYDWAQRQGMITKADESLSFDRYLKGMCTGVWDNAEAERQLAEGTAAAGGVLVPTPLSATVIDLARNATRVFQAGAQTIPMRSQTVKYPRLTGEGSPAWKLENDPITAADLTFDSVTFTARTLPRLVKLSVELFEDADPSAEGVIANSFAKQIALELDRVALLGTGTAPQPRGVLNQSGVSSNNHGANGASLLTQANYDWLVDSVFTVRTNNFEPNAQLVAPRSEQTLAKFKETTTLAYLKPPAALDNIPRLITKQIPINVTQGTSTDCSYFFTAQWDQLLIGMRTEFNLQFLKERFLADNLQYAFLAYLRADVQVAQPLAFAVDTGVRA